MPRPRKPSTLHKLEGTRPERGFNKREPQGNGRPRLPSSDVLTTIEQRLWKALVASLPPNLLTQADEQVLERMSIAWAQFRECCVALRLEGALVRGRDGASVRNPLLIVRKQAAEEMERCANGLGLSPAARTRITAPEPESDDPLALLLGENGRAWMTEVSQN